MALSPTVRRLAEYCSRHLAFTHRLPARFDSLRLRVSPGASLIYLRGLRQPNFDDLYDFAGTYVQAGQTVWDVGANMGVFSFAAAARAGPAGRVLCLEPDLWSARFLLHSRRLNRGRCAPLEILPAAASDEPSLAWLNIPERSRAAAHLDITGGGSGAKMTGGIREQLLVPTVTLDWLTGQFAPPDVLKIDVDGNEERVLRGAQQLLQTRRPVILVEVYERNADRVTQLLHGHGYTLYDFNAGEQRKTVIPRTVYNTLALPSAR